MEIPTTFAQALQAERKRLDLTQDALAKRVGTTQQNVGHWESGRALPRPDMRDRLIEVFGKDSPIAALKPRGVLNTPDYVPSFLKRAIGTPEELIAREEPVTTGFTYTTNELTVEPDESQSPGRRFHFELREALLSTLPEEYHKFIEPRLKGSGRLFRPDYCSSRLCIEISRIPHVGFFIPRVRGAAYQLLLMRELLPRESGRRFALFLVGDLGENAYRMQSVMADATVLGYEVFFLNDASAVAKTILDIETGVKPPPDEYDGSDLLGHPL